MGSKYGDSVRGRLYDVVHRICEQEAGLSLSADKRDKFVLEWRSPSGYRTPFRLTGLGRSWSTYGGLVVHAFTLHLPQDGESIHLSDDYYAPKADLNEDLSARWLLGRAQEITAESEHDHHVCIEAVG